MNPSTGMSLDDVQRARLILHSKFAVLQSNEVLIHCLHMQADFIKEQIVLFHFSTQPDEQYNSHSYLGYLKGQLACISEQLQYLTSPLPTTEESVTS